jgi:hypothetical protein
MLFLLIDNSLQVIILFVNFRHDLLFETNLACHSSLHPRTLLLMIATCLEDLFEFGYLLLSSILEGFYLVGLISQSTIETQDHVPLRAERLILRVLAKCDVCSRRLSREAASTSAFHLKSLIVLLL